MGFVPSMEPSHILSEPTIDPFGLNAPQEVLPMNLPILLDEEIRRSKGEEIGLRGSVIFTVCVRTPGKSRSRNCGTHSRH